MRFINIENRDGVRVAINTDAIGHIEFWGDAHSYVVLWCAGRAISTKFTSIEAAVDYIQRAQSISLTQGD
jgi:hypothetical protein